MRAAGCVFAEDEATLLRAATTSPARLEALADRRIAGQPLEQVLGWAAFCGLRIVVAPGVFVPRRRSELLVRTAVALSPPAPIVLDLCAGTGALGAAFAALHPVAELHVSELDPVAVDCARRNVPEGTQVYVGDLFAALPSSLRGRVDVLLANAPYVPSGGLAFLPAEAREHEPLRALDGGADGLDLHRRVVAGAGDWLAPGGRLFVEVSERQVAPLRAACAAAGFVADVVRDKELDATVLVIGRARLR